MKWEKKTEHRWQGRAVFFFKNFYWDIVGLPRWLSAKESSCQCGRLGFDPWVGKIPLSGKWQPTSVSLAGKFYGQRDLAGYSPSGHKESNTTERLSMQSAVASQCRALLHSRVNGLCSPAQQREWAIHVHVPPHFWTSFPLWSVQCIK